MRPNLFFSAAILLILLSSIQGSNPLYNLVYNVTFPTSGIEYYNDGLYYFSNYIYNSTSQTIIPIVIRVCYTYPVITPSVVPWCYNIYYNDTISTFKLYLLNNYMNQSVAYTIGTYAIQTGFSYSYAGTNFIIFELTGYQNSQNNVSIQVFNLQTKSFVCPKAAVSSISGARTIYTDGNLFLYGYVDANHNAFFVRQNCSTGESVVTEGLNEYAEINIYGFNSSSVFINYYEYQKNLQNTYYIQAGAFDSFNKLRFGSSFNITSFTQYNDTHFFLVYYPNNIFTFGVFVISPSLEIVEVLSFAFGIQGPSLDAYPVYGTNWVSIVDDNLYVTYDLSIRAIISVNTRTSPIILSNGSTVNYTEWGYFIQNPNGPFYFVEAPYSNPDNGIYQDPLDINQYYTLYVPGSDGYYPSCLLTHYNVTSSTITKTKLPLCPLTLSTISNTIQIKDVQFDANGNVHVAYRDALGSVFVVNPAGSNGPVKSTYLYSTLVLALNLTNSSFSFAGLQLANVVIGNVNFLTGQVIQTKSYAGSDYYYNTISKLSPRYFLFAYSVNTAIFEIYDSFTLLKVSSTNCLSSFFFSASTPVYIYGFNESSPANFTGIMYWDIGYIYLMNPKGETFILNPGAVISIYDVTPVGPASFFASQYQNYLYGQVLYQIIDWGTGEVKARSGESDDEILVEY